ncbi:MAG: glycosyltransferase [Chthoniobacterales bacterium]
MISIVTPSFRQLDWLRLAIASVADQEGVEWEHIIQDAGTSGIEEFLRSDFQYLVDDKRLQLFVEKDEGMYDAINRGLRRARGEICAYLNCDEQYLSGALRSVVSFFDANPDIDVLFGDVVLTDPHGQPLSYRRTVLPTQWHIQAAHLNTSTCATFFRRELVEKGFHFDPQWRAIGDMVWVHSLLLAQVPMKTLSRPLATFTFTGENLGGTSLSTDEATRWQGRSRSSVWRALAVLRHRLGKAFHGAYQRRDLEIGIYTQDSPQRRVSRPAKKLGYRWPRL